MQEIYAALLLHEAKQPITVDSLKKVLEAAGGSVDEGKLKALVASLEGKNIDELIQQTTIAPTQRVEEKEEKKEEKKEEEVAAVGLSALFG